MKKLGFEELSAIRGGEEEGYCNCYGQQDDPDYTGHFKGVDGLDSETGHFMGVDGLST